MNTVDLNTVPATMADIVLALGTLTIEIMAQARPDSFDDALIDIANALLDQKRAIADDRSRMLIGALAAHLVKTEEGAA